MPSGVYEPVYDPRKEAKMVIDPDMTRLNSIWTDLLSKRCDFNTSLFHHVREKEDEIAVDFKRRVVQMLLNRCNYVKIDKTGYDPKSGRATFEIEISVPTKEPHAF